MPGHEPAKRSGDLEMFQYSEASEATNQPLKSSNFVQVIRLRPPEGDPYFESLKVSVVKDSS